MSLRPNGLRTPPLLTEPKSDLELAAVPWHLTWIVAVLVAVLGAIMFIGGLTNEGDFVGGVTAVSSLLWLVLGVTGAYAALTSRRTWMRLRRRRVSGLVLMAISASLFALSAFLLSTNG